MTDKPEPILTSDHTAIEVSDGTVTSYMVQPFVKRKGVLTGSPPRRTQHLEKALRRAALIAERRPGVAVYQVEADGMGEFETLNLIETFGEVPTELKDESVPKA